MSDVLIHEPRPCLEEDIYWKLRWAEVQPSPPLVFHPSKPILSTAPDESAQLLFAAVAGLLNGPLTPGLKSLP